MFQTLYLSLTRFAFDLLYAWPIFVVVDQWYSMIQVQASRARLLREQEVILCRSCGWKHAWVKEIECVVASDQVIACLRECVMNVEPRPLRNAITLPHTSWRGCCGVGRKTPRWLSIRRRWHTPCVRRRWANSMLRTPATCPLIWMQPKSISFHRWPRVRAQMGWAPRWSWWEVVNPWVERSQSSWPMYVSLSSSPSFTWSPDHTYSITNARTPSRTHKHWLVMWLGLNRVNVFGNNISLCPFQTHIPCGIAVVSLFSGARALRAKA